MIAILTAVWVAMAIYVGVNAVSLFHVGLTSCLPADFPDYPRETLASVAISDRFGDCTVQFRTRDSGAAVQSFFEENLNQGDWAVTAADDQHGFIRFQRVSDPGIVGHIQVVSFGVQTQFQIQLGPAAT